MAEYGKKIFFPLSCSPGPIATKLLILLATRCSLPLATAQCDSFTMKTFLESQPTHCPRMVTQLGYQEQRGHKVQRWPMRPQDILKMQFTQLPGRQVHLFL